MLWGFTKVALATHAHLYRAFPAGRFYSSSVTSTAQERTLDEWIHHTLVSERRYDDEISRTKVRDLYYTLPTRDPLDVPTHNNVHLPPLHSLAFFHPRTTEEELSADLTETDFRPPLPYGARRMWASGAFCFPAGSDRGLVVGKPAIARASVASIEKKGFERDSPMVFVHQAIEYKQEVDGIPLIHEKRIHVYLPKEHRSDKKDARMVTGLPEPQYTFTWTPSVTTLFRFSALIWNAHLIHLDREYTRTEEGYPDLLVHGPLTALVLIEALFLKGYKGRIDNFVYRARNPVYVGRRQYVRGAVNSTRERATLWTEDEEGTVGMTGAVDLLDPSLLISFS